MATLNTKTVFEINGLTFRDIKSSKSTTPKLRLKRYKDKIREINNSIKSWEDELDRYIHSENHERWLVNSTYQYIKNNSDYIRKVLGLSEDTEITKEVFKDYVNFEIEELRKEIAEIEDKISEGEYNKYWSLWIAVDHRAIKLFEDTAKDLYELLETDKNAEFNIKGECHLEDNSLIIDDFEVVE